jgi:BirA family biotin operon repressor/biotin-[acetyl-CoA-carboxylase] ligase
MGNHVTWFSDVPSTNDVAARLADAGAHEGTLVGADAQSRGRGRHGRSWASPPGAGLYASVVLRPGPRAVPLLTIAAGVAVSDGIEAASGLRTCLKWPNDVLAEESGGRTPERKLAGILAEADVAPSGVQHVVIGVGINVAAAAYPADVVRRATSLDVELGRPIDRGLLLAECLAALWRRYADLQGGRGQAVLDAWRQRAKATLGRAVEWDAGDRRLRGTAEDVDESGALLVRTPAGLARVLAGEVRWT